MVECESLATSLLELIEENTYFELVDWVYVEHWLEVLHEDTPEAMRRVVSLSDK